MKILLAACNAKYIHSNLAVYNLRACAPAYRDSIFIKEFTINQPKDEILKEIYLSGAEVVCFSCYIWNISFVRELIADLKKILPDTAFWAGGPEVSFHGEKFLESLPQVTGVMTGEGEETFRELADYYIQGGKSLKDIKGIVYRGEDGIHRNEPRSPVRLDSIPFVYGHLEDFENRIIYYESSRGCPFSCSYCLSSIDKKLRFRSLELVKKELQFFLDRRVPQVKFVDRTFNCRHDHAVAVWEYILEHDNGVTNFHFEVSADLFREEELQLLERMRPGLVQLEIGVQSVNQDTLNAIRRKTDLKKLAAAVARVRSFGNIHQHLDLIAGLPYEDYISFRRSFNCVYGMKPDQLQLGFLKVLKGSAMETEAPDYGLVYKNREPYEVLSNRWLSYGEILKLKMVESMVEVYYNSGQFQNTLGWLTDFFEDAFSLYENLGRFYEKKGYSEISHSRMRRYEILLEFLEEETDISTAEASVRLVFDLYLRENLKKRPSFAPDQKPFEKAVWAYRREKEISKTAHIEVFSDGTAVLFDYDRRDPLSNNAHAEKISLSENVCG
ncbi:MAG TPA: B12-binding domain-containing radical SAM protein [Candidatus Blautia faecipullorum]|nr:B12-binding domain-containing radical SAM protein [Candidatus Blautia faecipullorum]